MYAGNADAWQPTNLDGRVPLREPRLWGRRRDVGDGRHPARPYDYGGNVVAQPTVVYVNGDPAGTPQQYSDQAGQIAAAGTAQQPDPNDQWLPLGIFAMAEPDQAQPTDLFQLAVNKQGVIRGNYHNVVERTDPRGRLRGPHDAVRRPGRSAGTSAPVYEAGLANLTTTTRRRCSCTPPTASSGRSSWSACRVVRRCRTGRCARADTVGIAGDIPRRHRRRSRTGTGADHRVGRLRGRVEG